MLTCRWWCIVPLGLRTPVALLLELLLLLLPWVVLRMLVTVSPSTALKVVASTAAATSALLVSAPSLPLCLACRPPPLVVLPAQLLLLLAQAATPQSIAAASALRTTPAPQCRTGRLLVLGLALSVIACQFVHVCLGPGCTAVPHSELEVCVPYLWLLRQQSCGLLCFLTNKAMRVAAWLHTGSMAFTQSQQTLLTHSSTAWQSTASARGCSALATVSHADYLEILHPKMLLPHRLSPPGSCCAGTRRPLQGCSPASFTLVPACILAVGRRA